MPFTRSAARASAVLLLALAACGGGDSGATNDNQPAAINTLAYVMTECRDDAAGGSSGQALQIQRGDRPSVTVMEYVGPGLPAGACAAFGAARFGELSVAAGAFQRLGVSPDGSVVVFELTDNFSLFAANHLIPPEQEGIYLVRADGSGLRRLVPASRDAGFRFILTGSLFGPILFSFAAGGRTVAYTDRGPGPAGEDAIQIFTLDLATATPRQLTHLPAASPPAKEPFTPSCCPRYFRGVAERDHTISFYSFTNPDGLNPQRKGALFTVDENGTLQRLADPVALPGSLVVQSFQITGGVGARTVTLQLDGTPLNHVPVQSIADKIQEVFLLDGHNLLQLTSFQRVETVGGPPASPDGQRVFLKASANPFGTNPTENCQIFSVDRTGADLRQLTNFGQTEHSTLGCFGGFALLRGCTVGGLNQDVQTKALIFDSTCDPFGTNPNGSQYFAMHPDGTGLRQLTNLRGTRTDSAGVVTVELPGPFAYGPYQ